MIYSFDCCERCGERFVSKMGFGSKLCFRCEIKLREDGKGMEKTLTLENWKLGVIYDILIEESSNYEVPVEVDEIIGELGEHLGNL